MPAPGVLAQMMHSSGSRKYSDHWCVSAVEL